MGFVFGLPLCFFAGVLNGLIPCGMVYLALAKAINVASIKGDALLVFLFCIGTTPLMRMKS
jgi:sulfite exporter TauE/SafE